MQEIDDSFVLNYCKPLSVLVVEDNETFLLQYKIILEEIFARVVTAKDGKEGLEIFQNESFDLLLTDHYMPKMRGLDMLQEISRLGYKTPSILSTSADESDILIHAINLNISHFLLKPWSKETLIRAITDTLRPHIIQKLLEQEQQNHLSLLENQKKYVETQQRQGLEKEYLVIRNDYYYNFVSHPEDENSIWFLDALYEAHDILNGDAYSMRKLNEMQTFVFIVDGMGKGIQASITSIISSTFLNYLTDKYIDDKNFDLRAIVTEYISFIKYNLLEDEMVSIVFALFDMSDASIRYASFSMPPMLLHKDNDTIEKIRSNNPPITAYTHQFSLDTASFAHTKKLLLCSDGLTESTTDDGNLYMSYIQKDFLHANNQSVFMRSFHQKTSTKSDDITLLFFYSQTIDTSKLVRHTLTSTQKAIDECVMTFSDYLEENHIEATLAAKLSLMFTELITNAYEHGSLGITQEEKRALVLEGTLFDAYKEREHLYHDKKISVDYMIEDTTLLFRICDEGHGFNTQIFKKLLFEKQKVHGRGFQISTHVADTINYSQKGNCVIIHKEIVRKHNDA